MATYAQLNSSMQAKAGAQLRTFSKTMTYTCTVYRSYTYARSGNANGPATAAGSVALGITSNYNYTGAADSLFNNYLDAGIYTGNRIYSQDVIDSINSVVKRTVDLIEGQIGNRTITATSCHQSCHTSCHTSRGRR